MKIYRVKKYGTFESYAQFVATGTWTEGVICPECTGTNSFLLPPLQIEWDSGSDFIGDFSWGQYPLVAIKNRVFRFLKDNGFRFRFERVEYMKPTEKIKKSEKRVAFPYQGPRLRWLLADAVLQCDIKKMGIEIEKKCMTCGKIKLKSPANCEIIILKDQWNGEKIFCCEPIGLRNNIVVSEEGRTMIEEAGFTNIAFKECGYIDL